MRRIVDIVHATDLTDDSVRLDHDGRTRRRMVYQTAAGAAILLDMPRTVRLRDGDGLVLDDGSIVRVEAAAEPLIEIEAPDVAALVRIAWHLGNRHLPTQLLPGKRGGTLRIRADHVIAEMVVGLGGTCRAVAAGFDPEAGAYATGGEVSILHAHGHAGDHAHAPGHHHHHHPHG